MIIIYCPRDHKTVSEIASMCVKTEITKLALQLTELKCFIHTLERYLDICTIHCIVHTIYILHHAIKSNFSYRGDDTNY